VQLQAGDAVGAAVGEQEALRIYCQLGDRINEAISLLHLGQIAFYVGDDAQAREHLDRSLAIAREIKHQEVEGACELVLGESAFEAGDQPRAYVRFSRSLAVCRDAGDKRGEASAQWRLGRLDLKAGGLASARDRLNQSLRSFRAFEMRGELIGCLEDHAIYWSATGSSAPAVQLAAAVSALRNRLGLARAPRHEQHWQHFVNSLKQAVAAESFAALWAEGESWELESAMSSALAAH
jgi:tetratricopeptide (TPR) repeat protein